MNNWKEPLSAERWGVFEAALDGPAEGNPFTDVQVQGTFRSKNETKTVDGFYDGGGVYRVRFMPSFEGEYTYEMELLAAAVPEERDGEAGAACRMAASKDADVMNRAADGKASGGAAKAAGRKKSGGIDGASDCKDAGEIAGAADGKRSGGMAKVAERIDDGEMNGTAAGMQAGRQVLARKSGSFTATAPSAGNHGPVRVANTYYFAYEDGTPYRSLGTTCYVWELQSEELQEQTLKTLKENAFNKIRFCIFPKHYDYNFHEPISYPFEGTPCDSSKITKDNFMEYNGCAPGNDWDFTRFNPAHFQHIERRIQDLMVLGIEADLIVMHPYDRWGFSEMDAASDDRYWNYVIARFSAYRNVWWSLANEYDLFRKKTLADWERYAAIICEKDPYGHLRSIHQCFHFYDHSRPWITHCSIQRTDLYKSAECVNEWRERYRKPVVLDEIAYEGNIQHGWGNISGQEMTRRFWEAFCRGGYPGHGETYMHPQGILWWSHGGELHGESPARIRFLSKIMDETPGIGVEPYHRDFKGWDEVACRAVGPGIILRTEYYIFYYSFMRPSFRDFWFNDTTGYEVEVIDTWGMTIEKRGVFRGKFRVELPGREYMAVRIRGVG